MQSPTHVNFYTCSFEEQLFGLSLTMFAQKAAFVAQLVRARV